MIGTIGRAALVAALALSEAEPRGGNERVIVVANGASGLSLALARRYVELRRIPIEHLLVLDDVPGGGTASADPVSLAECRERILAPIVLWLEQQALTDEIDAIVYSSGFPHAVDVAAAAQDRQAPHYIGGLASLTGLTYFAREVLANDLSCLSLRANPYCRDLDGGDAPPQSRGFGCDPQGRGRHHLSAFLAWLGPFGTSFDEAVAQLERSAAADGAAPRGTFYYLKKSDEVRTTTREPLFAAAMRELERRGRATRLLEAGKQEQDGVLPREKDDVLGAMIGAADFDWGACRSTIVPGAIVEHLTSFGATFQIAGQTKLTALLRAGAAGASGTVTEPYSIQEKFPTPFLHVHYVDGCSLVESFFASVAGPYQLLVVGDACCRPFAEFPAIDADEVIGLATPRAIGAATEPWRGAVTLATAATPSATPPPARPERFEAWIDGRLHAASAPGAGLTIDTTSLADGGHELHVVAVGPPPIGVAASVVRSITVGNQPEGASAVTLSGPTQRIEIGDVVALRGKAPAGSTVELLEGTRRLAEAVARGGSWHAELPAAVLGPGRCRIRARATTEAGGERSSAQSSLLELSIAVPTIATIAKDPGDLLPGFALDVGAKPKVARRGFLEASGPLSMVAPPGAAAPENATSPARGLLHGWVALPVAGLHEWSIADGELLGLRLDGKPWIAGIAASVPRRASFDARLAAGWHSFEIEIACAPERRPRLSLLGPAGPVVLADGGFGHGPGGMKRVRKELLVAREPGWCDGDRGVAVPAKEAAAELEIRGGGVRLEAVAVHLAASLPLSDRLRDSLVIEARDGGGWVVLSSDEIRVIHGSTTTPPTGACLLWQGAARRVRRLRIRSPVKEMSPPAGICEIECWEASGRK